MNKTIVTSTAVIFLAAAGIFAPAVSKVPDLEKWQREYDRLVEKADKSQEHADKKIDDGKKYNLIQVVQYNGFWCEEKTDYVPIDKHDPSAGYFVKKIRLHCKLPLSP